MEKRIGRLVAEFLPPEKQKFKGPLVLIHGLWSTSRCWREWAIHLSNLGWECWAVNLPGRAPETALEILRGLSVEKCVKDLEEAITALPFPRVLMGHGLGGLLAQKLGEKEIASALVLLSSSPSRETPATLPRALRLLYLKYLPLIFFRLPFRLEEKDLRESLVAVPAARRRQILQDLVPESARLVREFFTRSVTVDPSRIRCPILVIAGSQDRWVPTPAQRAMARRLGADFVEYPGHGHWIPGESGGETVARDIHRWLVKKLGEDILLETGFGEP